MRKLEETLELTNNKLNLTDDQKRIKILEHVDEDITFTDIPKDFLHILDKISFEQAGKVINTFLKRYTENIMPGIIEEEKENAIEDKCEECPYEDKVDSLEEDNDELTDKIEKVKKDLNFEIDALKKETKELEKETKEQSIELVKVKDSFADYKSEILKKMYM